MSDNIIYQDNLDGITDQNLNGFFVGWPNPPSPQTHLQLLENSYAVALALHAGSNRVVGFANAISDGVLTAYIPLLEVLPDWQDRGIGSELVRRLTDELDELYMVDLCCDEELTPFYDRLGFSPTRGMILRNYEHQSGRSE